MFVIESLGEKNALNNCILNSTITEYDIKSAGLSAIKHIFGENSDYYKRISLLPKEERNIQIGLMMRNMRGLSQKVDELMLRWLNLFIEKNNIKKNEFVENTRDSIVLWNKIPTNLKFDDFEMVNKEGSFSTFIRLDNKYKIFFDSLRSSILLKGVNQENVRNSEFVQKTLKNTVFSLEKRINGGYKLSFTSLQNDRINYLNNKNINIYREVLNNNQLCYISKDDGNMFYSDVPLNDNRVTLNKSGNYLEFLLPILRLGI